MSDEPRESIFEGNLYFNGINGVTGDYGLKPMSSERLARIIKGQADPKELDQLRGEQRHPETLAEEQRRKEEEEERIHLAELKDKNRRRAVLVDAPAKEGVDPTRLDQAGWAVVFPAKMETSHREAIKQALKPLLDLRQKQAGELYRVFEGPQGYRPGERKDQFFAHQDPEVRPGPADP